MEIKVLQSAAGCARAVAALLADKIREGKRLNIGFPTGRTMDAVYFHLAELNRSEMIDCSLVNAFLLDEYIGLNPGHKNLFQEYLKIHLFDQLNFNTENIHYPNVFAEDLDSACQAFEAKIKECGGLDLVLMGIGKNGHIAFNEPGSALDSRTRVIGLSSTTLKSNSSAFRPQNPPLTAITMGIGTILEARECMMIATGESKAEIIVRVVNGDINSQVPATSLKSHKNFYLFLDNDSGKLI